MDKAPDAFRTISEVATWLDTPAHVLRFWESRFPQIKPVKRAGGRRYYRPEDMALLGGIKFLLHEQGLTIRGVQKILSEKGVRHVADLSVATPGAKTEDAIDGTVTTRGTKPAERPAALSPPEPTGSPNAQAPEPTGPGAAPPERTGRATEAADETANPPAPVAAAAPSPSEASEDDALPPPQPATQAGQSTGPRTPPRDIIPDHTNGDHQPEFAFGNGAAPETSPPARNISDADEDMPPIAARLRAGARIAGDDLDTVRRLAARLSALRARMANTRPPPTPAR